MPGGRLKRAIAFRLHFRSVSATRRITVGSPVTAAELGVPLGTVIEETVMWHRNPITQLRWRIKHRNFHGRVRRPSLSI